MVTCRECRITRDLDKFYTCRPAESRDQALALAEDVESDSYRATLLVSFCAAHMGHSLTVFDDMNEALSELYDPDVNPDYKWDTNFWI